MQKQLWALLIVLLAGSTQAKHVRSKTHSRRDLPPPPPPVIPVSGEETVEAIPAAEITTPEAVEQVVTSAEPEIQTATGASPSPTNTGNSTSVSPPEDDEEIYDITTLENDDNNIIVTLPSPTEPPVNPYLDTAETPVNPVDSIEPGKTPVQNRKFTEEELDDVVEQLKGRVDLNPKFDFNNFDDAEIIQYVEDDGDVHVSIKFNKEVLDRLDQENNQSAEDAGVDNVVIEDYEVEEIEETTVAVTEPSMVAVTEPTVNVTEIVVVPDPEPPTLENTVAVNATTVIIPDLVAVNPEGEVVAETTVAVPVDTTPVPTTQPSTVEITDAAVPARPEGEEEVEDDAKEPETEVPESDESEDQAIQETSQTATTLAPPAEVTTEATIEEGGMFRNFKTKFNADKLGDQMMEGGLSWYWILAILFCLFI